MEKLLKLLNEYGDINRNKAMVEHQDTYIISKKFGFIKWLVENDKIKGFEFYLGDASLEIIQRLSISDNPIQDLISLLK